MELWMIQVLWIIVGGLLGGLLSWSIQKARHHKRMDAIMDRTVAEFDALMSRKEVSDREALRRDARRCPKCGAKGEERGEDADWGGCYTEFRCPECGHLWGVYGYNGDRFGAMGRGECDGGLR